MSASSEQPRVVLQDRDYDLLRGLFESRIMTRQHIAALYFEGKSESAKKRLQKLVAAGMIAEHNRRPNESAVLFLGKAGFKTLSDAGMLTGYPQRDWRSFQKRVKVSETTIRHELEVMDIKSAFTTAVRDRSDLSLAEFSTWPKLYEFRTLRPVTQGSWKHEREVLMKPDGFIRIHEQTKEGTAEHCFFLEVDRGTESLETLASKAIGYRNYYQSGGFAERCGLNRHEYQACPFRVLLVCPNHQRQNNIIQCLLQQHPPILTMVWLATIIHALEDPLARNWLAPSYMQIHSSNDLL